MRSALEAGRRVLREFGGLAFNLVGPGSEMALAPFAFYPMDDPPDLFDFGDLAYRLGVTLFPIGRYADGRWGMLIDGQGRVYLAGDVDVMLGDTIEEAVIRLALGRRSPRVSPNLASGS